MMELICIYLYLSSLYVLHVCDISVLYLLYITYLTCIYCVSKMYILYLLCTTCLHCIYYISMMYPFCISVQFGSVAQSCPTLCDPMNHSTPGLPVHHQLPEFTQTHIHRVGDAIQPSHPLSSPSPPAPNPSQHQSLFQ